MSYLGELLHNHADVVRALDSDDAKEIAVALRQLRYAGVRWHDVVSELQRMTDAEYEWRAAQHRRSNDRYARRRDALHAGC